MANKNELEPNEYFHDLKSRIQKTDLKSIESDMNMIVNLINDAKEIGQKALAENYENLGITFLKERIFYKNGINKYVHKNDIERYILSVKDQVVKICELEAFPRSLPKEVKDKIKEVRKLNLFDDLWVVFIDYTEEEILSDEDKEKRAKNRDPILFGTVKESMDRFYYIIDWEDDICDLRFDKMVKALKKLDKKYEVTEIDEDSEIYLQKVIKQREKTSVKSTSRVKQIWSKLLNHWKE